jgi:hypothetical protein
MVLSAAIIEVGILAAFNPYPETGFWGRILGFKKGGWYAIDLPLSQGFLCLTAI